MMVWVVLSICFAGLQLTTGCTSVAPVVKIGLVGPFEGRNREIGYDVIYSARLAVREINEAGGIGDYRVALVAFDDFGDPEMASQTAAALAADPAVVAVVGHWLPETTEATRHIYQREDLAIVPAGSEPFGIFDPSQLPPDFHKAFEEVTPFDEVPGDYAASAYDAINLVLKAMEDAVEAEGVLDRESVEDALSNLVSYEGVKGIYRFSKEGGL